MSTPIGLPAVPLSCCPLLSPGRSQCSTLQLLRAPGFPRTRQGPQPWGVCLLCSGLPWALEGQPCEEPAAAGGKDPGGMCRRCGHQPHSPDSPDRLRGRRWVWGAQAPRSRDTEQLGAAQLPARSSGEQLGRCGAGSKERTHPWLSHLTALHRRSPPRAKANSIFMEILNLHRPL